MRLQTGSVLARRIGPNELNLACLAHAYRQVVVPAVEAGDVPFGNCFVISAAGAAVLRDLGTDAHAAAVHVTFVDRETNQVVATDPAVHGEDAEPMRGVDAADLGNGHAVILTADQLIDLTFGQFDERGIAPRLLAVRLAEGWRGRLEVASPDGRWSVTIYDNPSDEALRRNEQDLPTKNEGLVEWMVEEALAHRAKQPVRSTSPGRNAPCPCGSGRKSKYCVH